MMIYMDVAFYFTTGIVLVLSSLIPGDGYLRVIEFVTGIFMLWVSCFPKKVPHRAGRNPRDKQSSSAFPAGGKLSELGLGSFAREATEAWKAPVLCRRRSLPSFAPWLALLTSLAESAF
jgi:hypothetical protein